jgi:hypothetical protein
MGDGKGLVVTVTGVTLKNKLPKNLLVLFSSFFYAQFSQPRRVK